jgi:hypothetical protein
MLQAPDDTKEGSALEIKTTQFKELFDIAARLLRISLDKLWRFVAQ